NKAVPEIMAELGYTPEWLSLGIVDEGHLRAQSALFQISEDKHPEHYRSRAFLDFLDRTRELTSARKLMRSSASPRPQRPCAASRDAPGRNHGRTGSTAVGASPTFQRQPAPTTRDLGRQ